MDSGKKQRNGLKEQVFELQEKVVAEIRRSNGISVRRSKKVPKNCFKMYIIIKTTAFRAGESGIMRNALDVKRRDERASHYSRPSGRRTVVFQSSIN